MASSLLAATAPSAAVAPAAAYRRPAAASAAAASLALARLARRSLNVNSSSPHAFYTAAAEHMPATRNKAIVNSCSCAADELQKQQQQLRGQQQQRRFAKILRWHPDTPLAHGLETFTDAEDFLKACQQNKGNMTRRDWLAALSLLSTRRRLDLRSSSFRAFLGAALQQQELLQPAHIHLTIHRLAVIGYSPALWQLALRLQPFLQQQQLSSKQLVVSAWGLAKNGVTHPPVWDLIGAEALRLAKDFSLADLSMCLWAFARTERLKPVEILALKEEVLSRLDSFVRRTLAAAGKPSQAKLAQSTAAAAASTEAAKATPLSSCTVTPHDLCMLIRSFADLTPRDSPLIIRLLYTLLLACRVQPPTPLAAEAAVAGGAAATVAEVEADGEDANLGSPFAAGGLGPLTAQGLTAVWTALKDTKIVQVFSVPQHKRPSSGSSSPRHHAYLPFRETVPLECLPLLLPILKPSKVYSHAAPVVTAAVPAGGTATATTQTANVGGASGAAVEEAEQHAIAAAPIPLPTEVTACSTPLPDAAAAVAAAADMGLRNSALLHNACTDVLLEVLCEETRHLRLDHTTNTSMVAALAMALADMRLVDPRVVYQLVLFAQQRGAAQFQGEQLLKVLDAFEDCQITDSKAWARLVHRVQDVAADLDLKGLQKLRQLARRSGHSNERLEGVMDHFEVLKEDIRRSGPL
ncbi:hypothetical protein, conserved [Eimeria necatrix]|uniref:Uncharacterized protein n=1 Tax=Eimeria necatrix TaxID=51315 RepID=U6MTB5_9EIME|nr:hypothetical protein, conserved [Eimeria necatrix]CDJ64910.1 hypothetical protein, conserved [Eimeria necatrix]